VAISEFEGVLIYKLQRKKRLESDADSTSTEGTVTSFQLLAILGFNDEYILCVRALLIKHSNAIIWDEDTLKRLHSMCLALLKKGYCKDTWLLDDATVLMTTSNWKQDSCVFEITISEEDRKDNCIEPLWVPSSM
jgi:hypothetical protein